MVILKPQSKRSLLENSLRVKPPGKSKSICFPKILFTEKYLFELAKSRSIFRFRMSSKDSQIKFCFTSHTDDFTEDFELDFERAKRLVLMLDPEYFDISIDSPDADSTFFKLIAHANDKLSMICDYDDEWVPEVVRFFWMRYNELYIPAYTLSHISSWILEAKTFEKVEVKWIYSDDDLALALKQQAKHLVIDIGHPEVAYNLSNLDLSRNVVNRSIKKCILKCEDWMFMHEEVLPIVEVVIGALQCLETFELSFEDIIYDEEQELDECVLDSYKFFCQFIESLKDKPFTTKFEMRVKESEDLGYVLPSFWVDRIQYYNPGLKDAWHKTEVIERDDEWDRYQTKMWMAKKVGSVEATFSATLNYRDLDWEFYDLMSEYDELDMEMGSE